ncbi:unnamed protein product [Pieris brassicae]|uniref:FP protein C-terminal domain-containing protein n=1 Tax=Pieris brassicae TaxID=7116 RepID=A0A9P0THJ6_PIEBR|nr:unnamed protein product [Pieris brassicae]
MLRRTLWRLSDHLMGRVPYPPKHLTTRDNILLNKTKLLAKEMDWRYVWIKHCKIQARRSDSSPVFIIKSAKDLQKITEGGM